MTEPAEAKLQATANLSPVSPSPVHTAAPLVVPALQDTVDTIDAMVAAAATLAGPNGNGEAPDANLDPAVVGDGAAEDAVDDDSSNDPYGDDDDDDDDDVSDAAPGPASQQPSDPADTNDDYAKTFDSPIEPEEEDGHNVPDELAESNLDADGSSDHLNAGLASDSAHDAAAHALQSASDPPAADGATSQSRDQQDPAARPSAAPAGAQEQTGPLPVAASDGAKQEDAAQPDSQDSGVDIQQLVADLTSQPAEPSTGVDAPIPSGASEAELSAGSVPQTPSTALPSSSSLPPRPPMPLSTPPSFPAQQQAHAAAMAPPAPGQQPPHASSATPGSSTDVPPSLPLSTAGGVTSAPYHDQVSAGNPAAAAGRQDADLQRHWDQFMTDERQYMSEAKWDRFPEGSRIFIGNLSSDKVSKRDVFEVFHTYGRLAQISLKSAYGFVQYHTVDEGRQAMENLQGIEIKGRRIHLEISRAQEKSKKDRGGRSPDRGRGRRGDKHNANRDDYRPGRNRSQRRNDHHARDDNHNREHGFHESGGRRGRGRSRSPAFGRNDRDSYRRRSPSPYGRSRREAEIDLPRRFGADVPDVQIILQPDVSRDFATWVEGGFKARGLKTEVMYLHPRIPKDQVVQRQAAEGVHGVVDLDMRAQSIGRIPIQAFDRTGGGSSIRFDQYVDLDPATAAEVILRTKGAAAAPNYGQAYGAPAAYGNAYAGQHQHMAHGGGYPGTQHAGPYAQPPAQQPAATDIANLVGQVDNATLQRLLSSMQAAPGAQAGYGVGSAAANNPQVDIQAILGSLGGQPPAQPAPQQGQYGAAYGASPPAGPNGSSANDPAAQAQVQNIMAQLARYRQ